MNKFPNMRLEKVGKKIFVQTKNCYPGKVHFGERTIEKDGIEYRGWDPTRSKLSAAVAKGMQSMPISPGDVVLYLGSGHGFTPSFVSDIVGRKGMVFALDFAPRVVRDLVFICEQRENMAPLLADAFKPEEYEHLLPEKVDVVFQDIAQKNQVDIFLKNVKKFLKKGGYALLVVKARSVDVTRKPHEIFDEVRKELDKHLKVLEYRKLDPFEKDHALFLCRKEL